MKPLFQFTKTSMAGNKKHEIIRVAQENLYMLKRLNEKTSVYNVNKWNRDYETSQYYKRSHCLYPSIDFYKTQRYGSFGNMFNGFSKNSSKRDFSKTYYSQKNSFSNLGSVSKKRKRFEEFNYRDLKLGNNNKSDKNEKDEKIFKKIDEIDNPEGQQDAENIKQENNNEIKKDEEENLKNI